jgi:ABC-type polar amino acid transport system ATPase subunit
MNAGNASETPLIEIAGLRKSYGPVDVLQGIDLTVRRGEVVALVGSSGSGKTTLLRCVNLLETPSSGRIAVEGQRFVEIADGEDKARLSRKAIGAMRSRIGMVFQHFNLFPHMSVLANVMVPARFWAKRMRPTGPARWICSPKSVWRITRTGFRIASPAARNSASQSPAR